MLFYNLYKHLFHYCKAEHLFPFLSKYCIAGCLEKYLSSNLRKITPFMTWSHSRSFSILYRIKMLKTIKKNFRGNIFTTFLILAKIPYSKKLYKIYYTWIWREKIFSIKQIMSNLPKKSPKLFSHSSEHKE